MTISDITRKLLTFSMLKGVGPAALRKLAGLPDFGLLDHLDAAHMVPSVGKSLSGELDWQRAYELADDQVQAAYERDARILSPLDNEYSKLLAATPDDPFLLFIRGNLSPTPAHSVAIIGTREPTAHGAIVTQRITKFFAERAWSIVSGLALGCDALAHQAALESGAHTVAVLAHGLQMIAPAKHRKLAEEIVDNGGALISEYRFGATARPEQFVKRDRTQAGLSKGVVMIQSDLRGGSLHASRAALSYGRWLAVPYPTAQDRAAGESKVQANLLIVDGHPSEKRSLLRCDYERLECLIPLRTKDDYGQMLLQTHCGSDKADLRDHSSPIDEEAFRLT